jgi:hypothetical protein
VFTVVVTCWAGARPIYRPWHVLNLRAMLAKHLTIPHKLVCVTDDVEGMERAGIEAVPLWSLPCAEPELTRQHKLNNFVRLGLCDASIGGRLGEWLVSIDLDVIIRANIDSLFAGPWPPFKIMSVKSRTWLQGGLFMVRPGWIEPNPWAVLRDDPGVVTRAREAGFCGSDQSVLSWLFYGAPDLPVWTEDDGLSINELDQPDWRIFFRTGDLKCWHENAPERELYLAESGADPATVPPDPQVSKTATAPGGLFTRVGRYQKLRRP